MTIVRFHDTLKILSQGLFWVVLASSHVAYEQHLYKLLQTCIVYVHMTMLFTPPYLSQCPIEWFHFQCVGLSCKPKGKWYVMMFNDP